MNEGRYQEVSRLSRFLTPLLPDRDLCKVLRNIVTLYREHDSGDPFDDGTEEGFKIVAADVLNMSRVQCLQRRRHTYGSRRLSEGFLRQSSVASDRRRLFANTGKDQTRQRREYELYSWDIWQEEVCKDILPLLQEAAMDAGDINASISCPCLRLETEPLRQWLTLLGTLESPLQRYFSSGSGLVIVSLVITTLSVRLKDAGLTVDEANAATGILAELRRSFSSEHLDIPSTKFHLNCIELAIDCFDKEGSEPLLDVQWRTIEREAYTPDSPIKEIPVLTKDENRERTKVNSPSLSIPSTSSDSDQERKEKRPKLSSQRTKRKVSPEVEERVTLSSRPPPRPAAKPRNLRETSLGNIDNAGIDAVGSSTLAGRLREKHASAENPQRGSGLYTTGPPRTDRNPRDEPNRLSTGASSTPAQLQQWQLEHDRLALPEPYPTDSRIKRRTKEPTSSPPFGTDLTRPRSKSIKPPKDSEERILPRSRTKEEALSFRRRRSKRGSFEYTSDGERPSPLERRAKGEETSILRGADISRRRSETRSTISVSDDEEPSRPQVLSGLETGDEVWDPNPGVKERRRVKAAK